MASAKDIIVKPIKSAAANALVKRIHYSGKVVQNSQLHFGVFLNGKLEGAMSFGSPMDKRKTLPLVEGTQWNGMLELNRMAFSDRLPRNSESRCMAVAFRLIKKHYPHIEWIISFSDGSQCGDGTIYRASGFVLTQIKENSQIRINPKTGEAMQSMAAFHAGESRNFSKWEKIKGFQLRYVYFLNPTARQRLTVPILPFSKIDEMGAGMYKGRPKRDKQAMATTSGTAEGQHLPSRSIFSGDIC